MKLLQWRDALVRYPDDDAKRFRSAGFWGELTIAGASDLNFQVRQANFI